MYLWVVVGFLVKVTFYGIKNVSSLNIVLPAIFYYVAGWIYATSMSIVM